MDQVLLKDGGLKLVAVLSQIGATTILAWIGIRPDPGAILYSLMRWQRKARTGVAIFGIVFAVVVYAAIGERQATTSAAPPSRFDPKAILESIGSKVQQVRLAKQDYIVEADRQLTYEDGSTRLVGVRIRIPDRDGRTVMIFGREAHTANDQKELQLTGDVKLSSSDGFEVSTDSAAFDQNTGMLMAPGTVSFHKAGLTGSGVGMSYDNNNEILSLSDMADVTMHNAEGDVTMSFTSGAATLARHDHLELSEGMEAHRGEQVLEADHGLARLSEDEEVITFIELRGNSRVSGGGTFDAMSAKDIDLDYSDDGETLERVVLTGAGAIAMAGTEGAAGRQFMGETLDLAFAPDTSLTKVSGRGNVRVDLPAAGAAARSVSAQSFDGTGEPGKGLTVARFADRVAYREEAQGTNAPRTAASNALVLGLAGDAIASAQFTGAVKFEERGGLTASAATARYDPARGTLQLAGADAGGGPRVANSDITIDATAIDVTLEGGVMTAKGSVKTTLQPSRRAGGSDPPRTDGRLPGLLKEGQGANVNAEALAYQGSGGKAIYTGSAALWQGETAIRGDVITIDQEKGDLIARGAARSTLMLDTGASVGTAGEIHYDEAKRLISYVGAAPPAPVEPAAGVAAAPVVAAPAVAAQAHLIGAQGDLRADRIDVALGRENGTADRLEAYTKVTVKVDTRVATGDRLTYFSEDGRYLLSGAPNVGVSVVEGCRETTGKTLTFFKSTDRIIVDGNEELRTQTKRGGPCPAPPPAR
jgi:LPS export ABC transporter protein LptC